LFLLSVSYGLTLYGVAFIIASFFPSKKTSASAASLVQIITFYLAFAFKGSAWGRKIKLLLSFIPNCALLFSLEHLFHVELVGGGLDFNGAW
jgi:hypothetical protein